MIDWSIDSFQSFILVFMFLIVLKQQQQQTATVAAKYCYSCTKPWNNRPLLYKSFVLFNFFYCQFICQFFSFCSFNYLLCNSILFVCVFFCIKLMINCVNICKLIRIHKRWKLSNAKKKIKLLIRKAFKAIIIINHCVTLRSFFSFKE